MNNMPLYQVLQAKKGNGNFTLAYILEGDFAGGQMLLCVLEYRRRRRM